MLKFELYIKTYNKNMFMEGFIIITKRKIILFGASNFGEKVFNILKNVEIYDVVAFTDNDENKQGMLFCGVPVISVDEAIKKDVSIIITSMYNGEISLQLNTLGFENYQNNIYFILTNLDRIKFQSSKYWENLYREGGNSGEGSFGRLAQFKAEIINEFVKSNHINTVIELGCGDGNQLSLMKYPKYLGLDISETAIKLCQNKFIGDMGKDFALYNPNLFANNAGIVKSDLVVSLDVIYHLVEDEVFEKYMQTLFSLSAKHIIIYSSNLEEKAILHQRCRKFTDWIDKNIKNFELINFIPNKYPLISDPVNESFADFYIYEKLKD